MWAKDHIMGNRHHVGPVIENPLNTYIFNTEPKGNYVIEVHTYLNNGDHIRRDNKINNESRMRQT